MEEKGDFFIINFNISIFLKFSLNFKFLINLLDNIYIYNCRAKKFKEKMMKKLIFAFVILSGVFTSLNAAWTNTIGNITYYHGDNGESATAYHYDNFTIVNHSDGFK